MKVYCIHFVTIILHISLLLLCRCVQAADCDDESMRCDISDGSIPGSIQAFCIQNYTRMADNEQQFKNYTLERGKMLTFTCMWKQRFTESSFKGNLIAPEGRKIFLRGNSSRNIKVTAEDRHEEDQRLNSSASDNTGNSEKDSRLFDSLENRYFNSANHGFLSRTNMVTIEVLESPYRSQSSDEAFNVIVRTVQVTDSVDSQSQNCTISRMQQWDENGYNELHSGSSMSTGSLFIHCSKGLPQTEHLISFCYDITVDLYIGIIRLNTSGFIQLESEYVNSKDLITGLETDGSNLSITSDFSSSMSFSIQFNARGRMDLNIYNVEVQGLISDAIGDEIRTVPLPPPAIMTPPPPAIMTPPPPDIMTPPSLLSTQLSTTLSDTNSTVPSQSTTESDTSSDIPSLNTGVSTMMMMTEGAGGQGSQGFLIPAVSVLAIILLVSIAVNISFCCWKRYHKNRPRDSDSTSPDENPSSINHEQHEYSNVIPKVKTSSDVALNETIESYSSPHNYSEVIPKVEPPSDIALKETINSYSPTHNYSDVIPTACTVKPPSDVAVNEIVDPYLLPHNNDHVYESSKI